jgi:hypothetical protein
MRSLIPASLAAVLLAIACPLVSGAQPVPAPTPLAPPTAAAPTAPPAPPTAAPLPSPVPTPGPPVNTPPPASAYHYIVTPSPPPPGQPAIFEIDMLEPIIRPGGPYSVRVKTSLDVTAINVNTMGQTVGMQGAGPGLFATDGQVPTGIPFFLFNRAYTVNVTALTADHRSTTVAVTLRLER